MRTVRRIIKIHEIKGYKMYCLFNTGESRIIDFEKIFTTWKIKQGDLEYKLLESVAEFQKVELRDGALTWKNIEIEWLDETGKRVVDYYDLDSIVMYELSEADPSRGLEIGLMIKQARKDLGLTQEELAAKSGTSKHYISRLENNKSGIELATLTRIIEGGFGRRLQIKIL
ncbi:MAG: hypothetical protein DA408_08135 [Bacteroidetes bacterium]|nr:MAG: hypothetical protein C7N36_09755 [Bacteroidota bacterium]PTM13038.1 MAG: hypothetical protein DA408_08135 [Bacteroidota bacterium]